jgi:NAD(P)-dependent dehydrogenase (short-subunit alcohol dehydrogenase family)
MADTWVIVGASRGIGLEFVRQILQSGHHVIAGVRNVSKADRILELKSHCTMPERCIIVACDITNEESIQVGLFRPR